MKISLYKFSKDFCKFCDFRKFPQKFQNIFLDRPKKYFSEKLEKIRISRSMQILLADRMEALSASENHSPKLQIKITNIFLFYNLICDKT